MSRSRQSPSSSPDELEELDEGAIIAHQAAPHSPQRRAQVADEARSVVISEQAAAPASRPYRAERAEATVVVRDRRGLERARRKILADVHGKRGVPRAVWFGIAFAAFAITASLVIVWVREPRGEIVKVVAPTELAAEMKPSVLPDPSAKPTFNTELPTPKISLEELPLERRPRRRQ
ncbi:MAG: hypothetical protein ACOY0T_14215 [Myxococcota bacterium]